MEGKLKISFIGDSHIAYWPFESYFPKWECYNYGVPGKGLDYVEMFHKDVSDSYVVVQLGTNDIYNLNTENMDVYASEYIVFKKTAPQNHFCEAEIQSHIFLGIRGAPLV